MSEVTRILSAVEQVPAAMPRRPPVRLDRRGHVQQGVVVGEQAVPAPTCSTV
jgi:hypothetical protein